MQNQPVPLWTGMVPILNGFLLFLVGSTISNLLTNFRFPPFLGFGFHSPKLRNPLQASYFYFCFLIFFSLLGSDYFSIKLTNSLQSLHFFLFESNWNRSMFYCFSDLTSGFFYFSLKLTNPLQSLHSFLFELK